MHQVILSLATNRFQKKNLSKARECLAEVLGDLKFSSELWTKPVGNAMRRESYLNQLATGSTCLNEQALEQWMKEKELDFGRTIAKRQLGIVPIDFDILQFDGVKRHEMDWGRPYVTHLLSELD